MNKLEHFKSWAGHHYPALSQQTGDGGNRLFFMDISLQIAWQAFQHAFNIRPTGNGRLDKVEFKKDDPATLVDRLNGIYPVPVPGQYGTSPLCKEAAREIVRLRGELAGAAPAVEQWWILAGEYDQHDVFACKVCKHLVRVDVQGVPLPEECPNCNDRPGPIAHAAKR